MEYNIPYEPSPYGAMVNRGLKLSNVHANFTIQQLIVAPARSYGYQQQVIRSFTTNLNVGDIDRIVEDISRNNGTLTNVNQSTNNVMKMGALPVGNANIDNGWNAPRYTFKMIVRCQPTETTVYGSTSDIYDLIVTGYSDASGEFIVRDITGSTYPNENLVFNINSIQKISINANANTITNIQNVGVGSVNSFQNDSCNVCVRPSDITSGITGSLVDKDFGGSVYSVNTRASQEPMAFERKDAIGKQYVNKILNAVVNGVADANSSYNAYNNLFNSGADQAIIEATSRLRNNILSTDLFIQALQEVNLNPLKESFTIKQLKSIDRTFTSDRIVYANVIEDNRFATDGILNSQYTEHMLGANRETTLVTELHNMLTNLMTEKFVVSMVIRLSNNYKPLESGFGMALQPEYFVDGNSVRWSYAVAQNDPNAPMLLSRALDNAVKILIDPMLSSNGNTRYDVVANIDLTTDTSISISLDGKEPILYRFPTFGDTCFTPMVGSDDTKTNLVSSLGLLVNEITDNISLKPSTDGFNSPFNGNMNINTY
jgi:hypothetical protein